MKTVSTPTARTVRTLGMNLIDERDRRNRLRRAKKKTYDSLINLSVCPPMLLSDRQKPEDEIKTLRAENAELKKQLAALKTALAIKETPKAAAAYTDGIGE